MIGPIAFGKEMQTTIHRWIGGVEPQGWQHQIRNDLVFNYEVNYEHMLFTSKPISVNSNGNFRIGTLNTKAQSGITLMLGKHQSLFKDGQSDKFRFYLYSQPLINVVMHDATLQGTFFRKSPYTIASADITRVNLQHSFGAILKLNKISVEYSRAAIGKEFKTGKSHKWGGFRLGMDL
jgi:hypothetical protein